MTVSVPLTYTFLLKYPASVAWGLADQFCLISPPPPPIARIFFQMSLLFLVHHLQFNSFRYASLSAAGESNLFLSHHSASHSLVWVQGTFSQHPSLLPLSGPCSLCGSTLTQGSLPSLPCSLGSALGLIEGCCRGLGGMEEGEES